MLPLPQSGCPALVARGPSGSTRKAARALPADCLKLERTLTDLVNRSAASARAWEAMLFIGDGRHARFNGLARSSPKQHIGRPFPLSGLATTPSERKKARKPCPEAVALSSARSAPLASYRPSEPLCVLPIRGSRSWPRRPLRWRSAVSHTGALFPRSLIYPSGCALPGARCRDHSAVRTCLCVASQSPRFPVVGKNPIRVENAGSLRRFLESFVA